MQKSDAAQSMRLVVYFFRSRSIYQSVTRSNHFCIQKITYKIIEKREIWTAMHDKNIIWVLRNAQRLHQDKTLSRRTCMICNPLLVMSSALPDVLLSFGNTGFNRFLTIEASTCLCNNSVIIFDCE